LSSMFVWFELFIAVPVLIYSLGRGRLKKPVNDYLAAVSSRDWPRAMSAYIELNQPDSVEDDLVDESDWSKLNCLMLRAAGYRAVERIFVVIFWFLLLGPAGALIYRLTALYIGRAEHAVDFDSGGSVAITSPVNDLESTLEARHLRWVLEWPAVRVLGLSLAMTGNFVNCIGPWKDSLWDLTLSTPAIVESYLRGTLGLPSERCDTDVITAREFKAILDLFARTLIFWMCLLAIITLLFNY